MSERFRVRSLRRTGLGALLACLLLAGDGQSEPQGKKGGKSKVDPQVKLTEAEVLKEAYILMAMANHNYGGHRGRAMKQTEEAITMLDKSILKTGTDGQK